TGSPTVGWKLKSQAGKKKVVLELGGNAACVIDETADIDDAVERLIVGAYYQSGQSCISVQRVIIHESVYDEVRDKFVARTRELKAGDPKSEETFIGPMISEKEAARLEEWVQRALAAGARLLCGGQRKGTMFEATVLEAVDKTATLRNEEAFGPVAILSRFQSFTEALAE